LLSAAKTGTARAGQQVAGVGYALDSDFSLLRDLKGIVDFNL
jgi:hypothetical protein